jgi:hypothetical protein
MTIIRSVASTGMKSSATPWREHGYLGDLVMPYLRWPNQRARPASNVAFLSSQHQRSWGLLSVYSTGLEDPATKDAVRVRGKSMKVPPNGSRHDLPVRSNWLNAL